MTYFKKNLKKLNLLTLASLLGLFSLAGLLTGCGQKGALYFPTPTPKHTAPPKIIHNKDKVK